LERLGFKLNIGEKKTRGMFRPIMPDIAANIPQMVKHPREEVRNQTASQHSPAGKNSTGKHRGMLGILHIVPPI
jgi:hypothetical protein